jgi:hypothetical protein
MVLKQVCGITGEIPLHQAVGMQVFGFREDRVFLDFFKVEK